MGPFHMSSECHIQTMEAAVEKKKPLGKYLKYFKTDILNDTLMPLQ